MGGIEVQSPRLRRDHWRRNLLPLLTATTKIGADAFIMRRLEKIADHLGADILVPSHISERR